MNYQEIIEGLKIDSVIKLMESLGADRYEEKENCNCTWTRGTWSTRILSSIP